MRQQARWRLVVWVVLLPDHGAAHGTGIAVGMLMVYGYCPRHF
jgi:hypothetical protein